MLHVLNFPPLRMDQQIVQQKPHKLDFLLPSHCQGVVLETAHIQTPIEEAQLAESDEIIRVTGCYSISQCQSHLLFCCFPNPVRQIPPLIFVDQNAQTISDPSTMEAEPQLRDGCRSTSPGTCCPSMKPAPTP